MNFLILPISKDKLIVNHKNGIKTDNSLNNLEWMSRGNNVIHSREILGIIPIPYSKNKGIHHLKDKKGVNSNKGRLIVAIINNESIVYGSSSEAASKLFGDENKGKCIRQAVKRGSKYQNIKFEDYESDNKT